LGNTNGIVIGNLTIAAAESNGMRFLDPSAADGVESAKALGVMTPSRGMLMFQVGTISSQHPIGALATMGAIVGAGNVHKVEKVLVRQWPPQGTQLASSSEVGGGDLALHSQGALA